MGRKPFNPDLAVGGGVGKPSSADNGISVWEVTQLVKRAIEDSLPTTVHVIGELSNTKLHSSGHLYCTLKDERSELACVMWRSDVARLKFDPADGMDVQVSGKIGLFEKSGRYQLYARSMVPQGVGALELAFRRLCEKLQQEGLFDEAYKKPIPKYPQTVAVLTSETGAAICDIMDTLKRRYPCAKVVFCPVPVQGQGAAGKIAQAIRRVNRQSNSLGGVDVMIVGRGGGSTEDLWSFNEEVVARAIFASEIPVISAVGHESDVSVADLVADVRAATPTAAAELAVPQLSEVLEELSYRESVFSRSLRHKLELAATRLDSVARRQPFSDPLVLIQRLGNQLADLKLRTKVLLGDQLNVYVRKISAMALSLQGLHPNRYVAFQKSRVLEIDHRLQMVLSRKLAMADRAIVNGQQKLQRRNPELRLKGDVQRLRELRRRLLRGMANLLKQDEERVSGVGARLQAMGHKSTLARGFSITRLKKGGYLVRGCQGLREGDRLVTEVFEGTIESRVVDSDQGELFD